MDLTEADLRGANLEDTWLWQEHAAEWQRAIYDNETKLPPFLDPEAAGLVFLDSDSESVADDAREEREGGPYLVGG